MCLPSGDSKRDGVFWDSRRFEMKTRNITKEEAHDIGHDVFVHLVDESTGADRDYAGLIVGFKNSPEEGFFANVEVDQKNHWLPLNRIFVKDE